MIIYMSPLNKVKNENNETLKAGCVVLNEKGEILLVSNQEGKVWSFPKGHTEHNEDLEQTAMREVQEETGYSVDIIKRLSDATYIHGETGEHIRVALFLARAVGVPELAEAETRSKWFSIREAREVIASNLVFLLDEI